MIDSDIGPFDRALKRVLGAFAKKFRTAEEVTDLTTVYFQALRPWPLEAVLAAGNACVATQKTFPKVADWIAALPPIRQAPADLRHMTVAEMDLHERAAAMCFEDQPCCCSACGLARIDHRPVRFVPTLVSVLSDDYEAAFNTRRQKIELIGHWAHGDELARWYAARDVFFALRRRAPRTLFNALAVIMGEVVGERQPGEEG